MNNKFLTVMALGVITLGVSACDDTTESTVTERSVVNGTEIETTTTRETTHDGDNTHIEIERERTVDPEGLMNKETTTEEYEIETDVDR